MPASETVGTGAANEARAAREAREVEILRGLVAIPSLSGEERPAVEHLRGVMDRLGFRTAVDAAGNAVGRMGDGPREVILLGHIDTVPGEIPVRVADGVLHGRGAVDAKGPLATFVCAAARALADGGLGGLRVTVIGAVGEEAESDGARHVATMPAPDCCVICEPWGWEGVVLGYKGSMGATYTLRQPGGHSAGPAASAPQVAVDYWGRVTGWAERFNAGREGAFDRLEPTLRAINSGGDGLYDRVELRMGFRLPLDLDGAALAATLHDLVRIDGAGQKGQEAEATVEVAQAIPAFRGDKNTPLVRALLGGIRAEGGRPRFKVKTGTADMNIVGPAWGCPIVAYGPGDAKLDHTPHERIEVAEYLRAIRVLAAALRTLGAASGGARQEGGQ